MFSVGVIAVGILSWVMVALLFLFFSTSGNDRISQLTGRFICDFSFALIFRRTLFKYNIRQSSYISSSLRNPHSLCLQRSGILE